MPCRAEHGFSLLEVMIAVSIFSIGLLGLTSMQVAAGNSLQESGELSLATNLAANKLDELRLTAFDTLAPGTETYNLAGALDPAHPYFTMSWTVGAASELKDVTVTVTWQRALLTSRQHEIELQTKIAQ